MNMIMNRALAVYIIVFSLLLVSCSPTEVSVTATEVHSTVQPTEPIATQTPIQTVTPQVTATTEPTTPTPAVTPDPCPGLENNVASQLGEDFFPPLLGKISKYLEQGRPIAKIPATFSKKPQDDLVSDEVGAKVVDLAGDGRQDVVVTISHGDFMDGSSGAFVFRKCPTGKYTIHYISADPTSTLLFDFLDVSVTPVKLLPDSSTQLIVSYGNPMSGRCELGTYLVIGLERDLWQTYLNDEVGCDENDISIVSAITVSDKDQDGRKGITLEGTRDTGWGVYLFADRDVRVTYTWRDDRLQIAERVFLPSKYRFHALEDAQIALEAGNLVLALQDYKKAFLDGSLEDSPSWYEYEDLNVDANDSASIERASKVAHQYQTAFAGFRRMVLWAALDYVDWSEYLAGRLALIYPKGKPGHEFAELASTFQKELAQSGNWQTACKSVNTLVRGKYPHLTGSEGHIGNWGDQGQGGFTVKIICPTRNYN